MSILGCVSEEASGAASVAVPPSPERVRIHLWEGGHYRGFVISLDQRAGAVMGNRAKGPAPHYSFGCVLEGQARVLLDGSVCGVLDPGDLFQRRPGSRRVLRVDPDGGYHDHVLLLDAESHGLLDQLGVLPFPGETYRTRRLESVAWAFRDLHRDLAMFAREPQTARSKVLLRVAGFLDWLRSLTARPSRTGVSEAHLAEAVSILRRATDSRADLPELLREVGCPYESLRKAFREVHGCSLGKFRIRARIDRAHALLRDGASVSRTADLLGYPDPFVFSKQFRAVTGHPPRDFRRLDA